MSDFVFSTFAISRYPYSWISLTSFMRISLKIRYNETKCPSQHPTNKYFTYSFKYLNFIYLHQIIVAHLKICSQITVNNYYIITIEIYFWFCFLVIYVNRIMHENMPCISNNNNFVYRYTYDIIYRPTMRNFFYRFSYSTLQLDDAKCPFYR